MRDVLGGHKGYQSRVNLTFCGGKGMRHIKGGRLVLGGKEEGMLGEERQERCQGAV